VSNINANAVTADELLNLFGKHGSVKSVTLSANVAQVQFGTTREALQATGIAV
jgi:RNA recognition motif-containing protein